MKQKNITVKEADGFVLGESTPELKFVTNAQRQRNFKPPYLELNDTILEDKRGRLWGFPYFSLHNGGYMVEVSGKNEYLDNHDSDGLVTLRKYEKTPHGYEYIDRNGRICYKPRRTLLGRFRKGYKRHYKYDVYTGDVWNCPELKDPTVIISNEDADTLRDGGQTDNYVTVDQYRAFDFSSGLLGEPATIVRDNDGCYWSFVWIKDSIGNIGYMSQHHIFYSGDGVMLYSEPNYKE
jgi:hypothetical protein